MLVAPLEAVDKAFISRHFIPMSVIIIPIVVRSTRKDEINPQGGCFGHAFRIILIPESNKEANCGCQDLILDLTPAVTPSLDEELPSVLLMLVG
jgi:hypothetical protein